MRWCYVKHGAGQSCRRNHLISVLSSLSCLIIYRPTGARRVPSFFLPSSLAIFSSLIPFFLPPRLYWTFLLLLLPSPPSPYQISLSLTHQNLPSSNIVLPLTFIFILFSFLLDIPCTSNVRYAIKIEIASFWFFRYRYIYLRRRPGFFNLYHRICLRRESKRFLA